MMQCRSSPEGPPSLCLDTISVSSWRRVVVVKTLRIHTALTLTQPPARGVAPVLQVPSGGRGDHPRRFAQAKSGTHHRSAKPYQEDPSRSTQLISAIPGSRPQARTIHNTATGFCASACARPGLASPRLGFFLLSSPFAVWQHSAEQSGAANPETTRPGSSFPVIVLGERSIAL